MNKNNFVSRGGIKLEHALQTFQLNVSGMTVLDVGSSTGGFVNCLLQHGSAKVYSLDTAYGELAWKLRQDPRVVVLERTNILFLESLPPSLPSFPSRPPNSNLETVDLVTIDVTFTSLTKILPKIKPFLKASRKVIALLKPQYEDQNLALKNRGVIPEKDRQNIVNTVINSARDNGWRLLGQTQSPIMGKDGNTEYLLYICYHPLKS